MPNATVLIVDDEKNILLTLNQALALEGYKTELAAGGQLALDVVAARPVDAVLMDVKMPDMDGLAALAKIQKLRPNLPVIMMSGHGTIETAVKATQQGARDFLEKPISRDRLLLALRNALTVSALVEELTTLKQEGLEENTLVFFASDNGGPTQQTTSSNGPLNGVKGLVLEGGIRVPAIARWKGHLTEGEIRDTLAMGFDLTATSLAAAGVMPRGGLDGVDLMPYLAGVKSGAANDALFWRSGAQGAMRSGDWKLVKNGDKWHLFNLSSDIGERKDLASVEPTKLAEMKAAWSAWSGQMKAPLWVRNELAGGDGRAGDGSLEAIEKFIRGEVAVVNSAD